MGLGVYAAFDPLARRKVKLRRVNVSCGERSNLPLVWWKRSHILLARARARKEGLPRPTRKKDPRKGALKVGPSVVVRLSPLLLSPLTTHSQQVQGILPRELLFMGATTSFIFKEPNGGYKRDTSQEERNRPEFIPPHLIVIYALFKLISKLSV